MVWSSTCSTKSRNNGFGKGGIDHRCPENWALENWAPRFFGNLGSNFSENWAPAVIWALREKIGILGSKILGSGGILGSEEKSQIMQKLEMSLRNREILRVRPTVLGRNRISLSNSTESDRPI